MAAETMRPVVVGHKANKTAASAWMRHMAAMALPRPIRSEIIPQITPHRRLGFHDPTFTKSCDDI
jgi:hypothetical protein